MTSIRCMSRAYNEHGEHTGPGEWLQIIHESNRIHPGMFGAAESRGPWWAGGSVEEYTDARIIHRDDSPTVSVVSKTELGDTVLRLAAANLGIVVQ